MSPVKRRAKQSAKRSAASSRRRRLSADLRRSQILQAASTLLVQQGYLPLSIESLAQAAAASKALVYTYFPTQYQLFNSLLQREMRSLALGGLETAARVNDLDQSILLCAMLYFEHVAQYGPLLHILLTDLYMAGRVDADVLQQFRDFNQRLWQLAQKSLSLTAAEFAVSLELIAAIPEESGTLVFDGRMDAQAARELCHTLVLSSLRALHTLGRPVPDTDDRS